MIHVICNTGRYLDEIDKLELDVCQHPIHKARAAVNALIDSGRAAMGEWIYSLSDATDIDNKLIVYNISLPKFSSKFLINCIVALDCQLSMTITINKILKSFGQDEFDFTDHDVLAVSMLDPFIRFIKNHSMFAQFSPLAETLIAVGFYDMYK
jgi:hypothetical protein